MKRNRIVAVAAWLILLCMLTACGATSSPPETVPAEKAAENQMEASPMLEETANWLLANVPDQNRPLLLDIRSDGSVDYLYAGGHDFSDGPVHHYLIAPDGTAE